MPRLFRPRDHRTDVRAREMQAIHTTRAHTRRLATPTPPETGPRREDASEKGKRMTPQEAFTRSTVHLLAQDKKSILPSDNRCKYRTPTTAEVCRGALVLDEDYDTHTTQLSVPSHSDTTTRPPHTAARQMQRIHDHHTYMPLEWPHTHGYCTTLPSVHTEPPELLDRIGSKNPTPPTENDTE